MASLPKTIASVPLKIAASVGNAIKDPMKPVREIRDIWNSDDEAPENFQEMTLAEHLDELRIRLTRTCYVMVPAFLFGLLVTPAFMKYLKEQTNSENGFQALAPTEPFTVFMKVALYIAISVGFPMIFYQLFGFISPGMTRKEKRYLLSSLPFVVLLFVAGGSFAFFIALPQAFDFLSNFQSDIFSWDLQGGEVISFYTTLMLGMGIAFELPLVMFLLARLGIVNSQKQRGFWRIAFILIMVAAAIITPTPDPFNMMIVASPLFVLYGVGLLLARRADKEKAEKKEEAAIA